MLRLARAALCGLALVVLSLPAFSAELPALREVKEKPSAHDMLELRGLPEPNAVQDLSAAAGPRAVFRRGCINFPGQRRSYTFFAAVGNNFYRVIPQFFFDVVMRVQLQGFRPVRVDRFFAGGIERLNFFSPPPRRLVTVTISGFLGSVGCFQFEARP